MLFWIMIGGFFLLSLFVGNKLKSKFKQYSTVPTSSGLSGAEIAEKMLRDNRIYDVKITCVPGDLTDHYNPTNKTINLSQEVYYGRSVSAAAVAAHETGHALQHATAYSMLELRSALVPIANISGKIMNFIFLASIFLGFVFQAFNYQTIGLIVVGAQLVLTLFSVITLPVEFDASNRALLWLEQSRITVGTEHTQAKDALKWAAGTYLVAALASISTLLYYVMSFMGGSDD